MQALTKTKERKINDHINAFRSGMVDSAEAIKTAAKHYYEALRIDPIARDMFTEQFPTVSSQTWSGMIRIASGEMDHRLLFDATPGARALTHCDATTQSLYINKPIPVCCGNGDTILVQLDKMTSEQTRQVFNRGAIRDIAEQRAWIETQKTRAHIVSKPKIDKANDVFVKGAHLHVGKLKLSRAELLRYLAQMEA